MDTLYQLSQFIAIDPDLVMKDVIKVREATKPVSSKKNTKKAAAKETTNEAENPEDIILCGGMWRPLAYKLVAIGGPTNIPYGTQSKFWIHGYYSDWVLQTLINRSYSGKLRGTDYTNPTWDINAAPYDPDEMNDVVRSIFAGVDYGVPYTAYSQAHIFGIGKNTNGELDINLAECTVGYNLFPNKLTGVTNPFVVGNPFKLVCQTITDKINGSEGTDMLGRPQTVEVVTSPLWEIKNVDFASLDFVPGLELAKSLANLYLPCIYLEEEKEQAALNFKAYLALLAYVYAILAVASEDTTITVTDSSGNLSVISDRRGCHDYLDPQLQSLIDLALHNVTDRIVILWSDIKTGETSIARYNSTIREYKRNALLISQETNRPNLIEPVDIVTTSAIESSAVCGAIFTKVAQLLATIGFDTDSLRVSTD